MTLEFKAHSISITTVTITTPSLDQLDTALEAKLSTSPQGFFTATPFVADLNQVTTLDEHWLIGLKQCFKKHGLILIGVNQHPFDVQLLSKHDLADMPVVVRQNKPTVKSTIDNVIKKTIEKPIASEPLAISSPENKVIRGNVRSGQRIYAPNGDLTIIGTVGAGAEVIADGNIYILGNLRGRAFAGVKGNKETYIFANEFSAEIVSIDGNYQNMEQLDPYKNAKNCLVTLNKDETMLIVSLP